MLKNEREQEILKILETEKFSTVKALSDMLFTSESSIRRDLSELEASGYVKRSYGGVELLHSNLHVIPFSMRAHHNAAAKKTIAKKAAAMVKDGSIIFLDQSSSSLFLAYELLNKKALTITTNNVEILTLLADSPFDVISSGGYLSRKSRNCLVGDDAHRIFADTHADFLFFSAKALSRDGEISDCTREEVCLRNTMIKNSSVRVFLCDSEKFNKTSAYRQCMLSDIDYMVTESDCCESFEDITVI